MREQPLLLQLYKRQGRVRQLSRRQVPPATVTIKVVIRCSCSGSWFFLRVLGRAFQFLQLFRSEFDPGSSARALHHLHQAALNVLLLALACPIRASRIQDFAILRYSHKGPIRGMHPDHAFACQAGTEESAGDVGHTLPLDALHILGEHAVYSVQTVHTRVDVIAPLSPRDPGNR